jgi:two-component system cell cycle sensor histidine kinase/response regulator CckA
MLAMAVDVPPNPSRLLVVDDDDGVLKLVCSVLSREGHKVLSAHDGSEALELVQAHGKEIDVLVTDIRMPGLGGHELAKAARDLHPRIGVIYMTGFSEEQFEPEAVALRKPFRPDVLKGAIQRVIATRHPKE